MLLGCLLNKKVNNLRVVFIFKNFGLIKGVSHIGLGVASANTSETLKQNGISTEVWSILNAKDLVEQLHEDTSNNKNKPITHIIISAPWIPTSLLAELTCKYTHINFVVVSHSNVGFLAADRNGIKLLREEVILQNPVDNFHVAGNSKKFADWASLAWGADIVYLPNLYNVKDMKFEFKQWDRQEPIRIGCFGALRPLKNQITAAASALAIVKELDHPGEIWFSSGRNEGWASDAISQLVGNINDFKIKNMPWAPWYEFRKFVGTMHLNLQPSYTESFNMVVADSVYESIPAVVSEAIPWTPKKWIANSDDALDIARKGIKLITTSYSAENGQTALRNFVSNGVKAWEKFLLKK
jgi:glycosyltransferase involved in cell wall biosynthesis